MKQANKNILKGLVNKKTLSEQEKESIKTESSDQKEQARCESIIKKAGSSNVGEIIKKLQPAIELLNTVIDIVSPFAIKAIEVTNKVYNMLPIHFIYALIGLVIAFFGGVFAVTLSAFEAFYASGWETVYENGNYIYKEFKILWKKSREDDEKDEDGDGIKDVLQISAKELVSRKIGFFFANCSDPQKLMDMIYGITNSFFTVVAVLKVEFAKVIALGASIGENLRKPVTIVFAPILGTILPQKYHQWIGPGINLLCKTVAITIAWMIQRIISSVQSGVRGGLMFSRRMLRYANEKGWVNIKEEDTYLDEIVGWFIAAIGVYFQITNYFGLPFPLNVLLYPVSLLEGSFVWIISE